MPARALRGRVFGNADASGNGVGRAEPYAHNVARETVGVVFDCLHSVRAVDFVDFQCPCSSNPVRLEKNHDVAHCLMPLPRLHNLCFLLLPYAGQLKQPLRLSLNDDENIRAPGTHHHRGKVRPHPLQHAGSKIVLHPLTALGGNNRKSGSTKLHAPIPVVLPSAHGLYMLTRSNGGNAADNSHLYLIRTRGEAKHGKTAFRAEKRDLFNYPTEPFIPCCVRFLWISVH